MVLQMHSPAAISSKAVCFNEAVESDMHLGIMVKVLEMCFDTSGDI
jgi:hypothetical protein